MMDHSIFSKILTTFGISFAQTIRYDGK